MEEIRVIRRDHAEIDRGLAKLERDGQDVLAWFEARFGFADVVLNLDLGFRQRLNWVWFSIPGGRRGLSVNARRAIVAMGRELQQGGDVLQTIEVTTTGMSMHRRLSGIARVQHALSESERDR